MQRDEVFNLVRDHLAEELEVDPAKIADETRFKQDLDADSLDLYELVMELEDRYGISVSEEQAARIETVGDAVSLRHGARSGVSAEALARARRGAPRRPAAPRPYTFLLDRGVAPTPTSDSPTSATACSRSPSPPASTSASPRWMPAG